MTGRKYPPIETLGRIKKWCDIQERSHSSVRRKLISWGVFGDEIENVIAELIASNFLSEEGYARAFVSGKFRINGWGKRKIRTALKADGVSEISIGLAMSEIEDEDYWQKLNYLTRKKAPGIKSSSRYERNHKLTNYLLSRGYEPDLIKRAIKEMESDS